MTFYSFPRHLRAEGPRDIRIPIMGRITAQSIIDEAEDILTAPPSMAVMVVPGSDMELGSAIQLLVNQYGFGWPMFGSEEEMRAWYRQMGLEMDAYPLSLTGAKELMESATTLRQRVFARMCTGYNKDTRKISLRGTDVDMKEIKIITKGARGMMAACYRDRGIRASLRDIPIVAKSRVYRGDPEIHEALQDLADIVSVEARRAFTEPYYPGMPDVAALTDKEVDAVMDGLQREVTREKRGGQEVLYGELPRPRQIALAERRRHWFGVFGITPKSWSKGTWSLWKVKNVPYPEGYKASGR
ncbi:hypothetical protein LCGC14_1084910 [marine sediment metagenome]|uniref:Uncharacterized protein n=1 Tax=marine sediment metagenome TaxID=412755 RepID=A0A0F9ME90_9ZZZZ